MRAARIVLWALAVPLWAWACAALALLPHTSWMTRAAAAALLAVVTAVACWKTPRRWRVATVLAVTIPVVVFWMSVEPATDRTWAAGQERTAAVTFDGDIVTVQHVRNATWHSTTDVDVAWETRHYDLRALRSVDLVIEPFAGWRGPAHIFVTFGFADDEHVAISIEARREAGEAYSIPRGAFRHFEVLYVIGDERDLIGMRANIRRDPVYVFPTRATPAEARQLFESMLRRAAALAQHPEFYHSVFSTCATNLLEHVNDVRTHKVSLLDWRIAVPGYADELAWDLGLIDWNGTLEEARARFRINERSAFDQSLDGAAWSRRIRGLP